MQLHTHEHVYVRVHAHMHTHYLYQLRLNSKALGKIAQKDSNPMGLLFGGICSDESDNPSRLPVRQLSLVDFSSHHSADTQWSSPDCQVTSKSTGDLRATPRFRKQSPPLGRASFSSSLCAFFSGLLGSGRRHSELHPLPSLCSLHTAQVTSLVVMTPTAPSVLTSPVIPPNSSLSPEP